MRRNESLGKIKNWPRAKGFNLRLTDPFLSRIEHYAAYAKMSVGDYLVAAGMQLPEALAEAITARKASGPSAGAEGETLDESQ
jgi:hypothetical protein